MPSAIHSLRSYWNRATTSPRFRNSWGTRISTSPWCTPICSCAGLDVTAEPISCSDCDKGLPGPITTAHYEQSCLTATAAARV